MFQKKAYQDANTLAAVNDFLLWYAKDKTQFKPNSLYLQSKFEGDVGKYNRIISPTGEVRSSKEMSEDEINEVLKLGWKLFREDYPLVSQDPASQDQPFKFEGRVYRPSPGRHWSIKYPDSLELLAKAGRIRATNERLYGIVFWNDNPVIPLSNFWDFLKDAPDPLYVVQTATEVIKRAILMATAPGDLVLDPTCGSGTSAIVAEQWGRRWITCDVSRVPLALARQRLLTATFPYFDLKDEKRGPIGGFVYKRKLNNKGEEVGGIVPHITLESLAYNEPPKEEVLVDRPEIDNKIIRITGPFAFEATIPTPVDYEGDGTEDSGADLQERGSFIERMLEVLRQSPVIQLPGNKKLTLKNIRLPAKTLSLSAEALVPAVEIGKPDSIIDLVDWQQEKDGNRLALSDKPLAIVFGPESGAVSEKLVWEAGREASAKNYAHLLVIGFAIQPNARELVEKSDQTIGIASTYIQMTPDLMMGDLLKNMRSSQIFSVCGLPDIKIKKAKDGNYQVELLGLDVFDPSTMEHQPIDGNDVPAWFLDTDYNGLCFHVCQAFFPRTGAWESLKKALKGSYEESVWDHLSGTVSEPFEPGEHRTIAVKVIDDRGNELIVTKVVS